MRSLAIKMAGPFRATSRADGTVLVTPCWEKVGLLGIFGRLELAEEIEDHLNAMHNRMATKRKVRKR